MANNGHGTSRADRKSRWRRGTIPACSPRPGPRRVISKLFGQFADKREAIAAANAIQPTPADGEFDYSGSNPGGDFWFDYLADSGDGWNPTFAMARLVAEDRLTGDEAAARAAAHPRRRSGLSDRVARGISRPLRRAVRSRL